MYNYEMGTGNDLPQRQSNRLQGYDYSWAGAYFVTIVTQNHEMLYGEIAGKELRLNEKGKIVEREWERTEILRPNVLLDEFVVCPIMCMESWFWRMQGRTDVRPMMGNGRTSVRRLRRKGGSLGSIIAGYKSTTTKQINQLRSTPGKRVWQRSYYDRVIRNEKELQQIHEYIAANLLMWPQDEENPGNVKRA